MIKRPHLVGGAAITEELRPGFWFTTFSYALSLLGRTSSSSSS